MIPNPYTVNILRRLEDGEDRFGDPIEVYSKPEPIRVHGWSPGPPTDVDDPVRDADSVDFTIYGPAGTPLPSPRDRVEVPGEGVFNVVGKPQDWSKGPWNNPVAGVVILVKRVEG